MKRTLPLINYEQLPHREFNNGYEYRYSIKLGQFYYIDQAGYSTTGRVYIKDNITNKVYVRRGEGRQIGNFHPIFINFNGKKEQIESLTWILSED
jgi:hypothetical protein